MKQKTLKQDLFIRGIGVHSNKDNIIRLSPAKENTGINFFIDSHTLVKAILKSVSSTDNKISISYKDNTLISIEHLISSLYALDIQNCSINLIKGREVPILDGSASEFVKLIEKAGIIDNIADIKTKEIPYPICIGLNKSYIIAMPRAKEATKEVKTEINAHINFKPAYNIKQSHCFKLSKESFIKEIAPARTFGFYEEWETLKKQGKALGAGYANTIVFNKSSLLNPPLRAKNECARHKILDFIAMLSLLEYKLIGRFYLYRSGHTLDFEFAKTIDRILNNEYTKQEGITKDKTLINSLLKRHFAKD